MWVEGPERLPRERPRSSGRIYIGVAPAPHPHEKTLLGFSAPPPTHRDPGPPGLRPWSNGAQHIRDQRQLVSPLTARTSWA